VHVFKGHKNLKTMIAKYSKRYILLAFIFISLSITAQNKHESLGSGVNSLYDEENPVLSPDGKKLYFVRKNHRDNVGGKKDLGDIWYAEIDADGQWGTAKNLGKPINNKLENRIIGFSNNGNTMILKNHYTRDGSPAKSQGVSYAELRNGKWSSPLKMDISYFYNKSDDATMSVSADGKVMLLSIQSYDTKGAEDIYVSFSTGFNKWSQPVNLGSTINTQFQEMTPYIASDNMTIFFASNGHGGFGSRDIFISRRLDDTWKKWTKPTNLGASVNTEGVELSYILPGGDYAYLVSTQNSEGYGDIQRVRISPEDKPKNLVSLELVDRKDSITAPIIAPVITEIKIDKIDVSVTLKGKVVDANEVEKPIVAQLDYIPTDDLENHVQTTSDGNTGLYNVQLTPGKTYTLRVSAEGYMTIEENLVISGNSLPSLQKHYLLTPLKVGTTVNLKSVLFEQSTANLMDESYIELDQVSNMLKENPNIEIELTGHTDNRGNAKLNLALSKKRVDAVMYYLISKGTDPTRIKGKGFGGTKPIASNRGENTRKLNRRVEFTIIKN